MNNKPIWIAAIARGHNAGVCLLKDGKIVFSIEEERLSRHKYDGGPYASMIKILEYTDKIDYLVVAHTQTLKETAGRVDFTSDDVYTGLARKLGLIDRKANIYNHPQVIDLSHMHHKLHAACAFYRSGFETAAAVIVDGAGTFIPLSNGQEQFTGWETETIFDCSYPDIFKTKYKHVGIRGPAPATIIKALEDDDQYDLVISDRAGIVKVYEAVTQYCGFSAIEAGKTMGLFPYGKENKKIPELFDQTSIVPLSNRNLTIPTYPNAGIINSEIFSELTDKNSEDLTRLKNRRDLAFACQTETQNEVLKLIRSAVEYTENKNVVMSGGYGLNCVANYFYLEQLKDEGINLYVEPISSDAGTAIGAALYFDRSLTKSKTVSTRTDNLYLGPAYQYQDADIQSLVSKYSATMTDATDSEIVELLIQKNIVAIFQGSSENGPRALGNRSLIFDPRFKDGKDFVNSIKRREYFRPFAGSILEEHAHNWFDLRGMDTSPTMMYAVNCRPGIEEKIPSVIHVDGTCRIQTVSVDQNPFYYKLIKTFYDKTECPMVFNTSFNLGGEPLVETLEDAFWTLDQSNIEYLYLPEHRKLIKLENSADLY